MHPTVLLFDVDGTLITTGGAGRRAMLRALATEEAEHGASFSFAGMTDRLILRQALREAGLSPTQARIDAVIERYLEALADEVRRCDEQSYLVHPGMREAVEAALGREGLALGLGTGNVERGARIKLGRVALSSCFGFGGFGCDAEDRAELLQVGAERGAARLGVTRSACRVVVVGDTPRDVQAARAIGAEVLAVATGTISRDELAACHPEAVFDSLADPEALRLLFGS